MPVEIIDSPVVAVANGTVCSGGSIDLATLVTNAGGGTLSFYTTLANAQAGTNPLPSSTVSPASATNYYVRSTSGTCYGVKEITITIQAPACGTINVNGPN
jgi:Ig-like domain CHU_C associated